MPLSFGSNKQAVFRNSFGIDISNGLHPWSRFLSKEMKHYVKYQRRWYTKSQFTLPSPSPVSQNRKSGVDASFSFNFGLYRLMRRLSFTFRKKSFLRLSLPITSKSNNSPWWFVDVMCSYTAVGFVLLVDGCRVKGVNFKCSHQRTVWCRSVLPI